MSPSPGRVNPLSLLLIAPIRLYQRVLSPLVAPRCRYAPTCSAYAVEALRVHGPLKGLALAGWRLVRCNPWSLGGVDHVPPRGRWRAEAWVPPEDWAGNDDTIEHPAPMGMGTPVVSPPPAHPGSARGGEPIDEGGAALVVDDHPAHAGRTGDALGVPTI